MAALYKNGRQVAVFQSTADYTQFKVIYTYSFHANGHLLVKKDIKHFTGNITTGKWKQFKIYSILDMNTKINELRNAGHKELMIKKGKGFNE
jgi:hypothetical protein